MKRPLRTFAIALAMAAPLAAPAADHGDSPTAASTAEPSADITDLYAWMTADATKLNLVAAVYTNAGEDAVFSDAVIYQFAVSSAPTFGAPQRSTLITCRFPDGVNVECWAGDQYVVGNPTDPAGIVSAGGGLRVFAGLRDDPFFLEYTGFQKALDDAVGAVTAGVVEFPEENQGCPALTEEQANLLVGDLTHNADGGDPTNTFAGQNVLALVLQVDKSIVDGNGPVLGVSVSTYSSN